jgi:hypothetical protein
MAVWQIDSLPGRPQVTLTDWAVFDVPLNGLGQPWTRHLAGWSCEDGQGQVSSAVQCFDPVTQNCVTKSGRLYRLAGRPGLGMNAEYVWNRWKGIAAITEQKDVTHEVFQAIQAMQASTESATPPKDHK